MKQIEFFQQVKAEVAKVKWPGRKEVIRLSMLVVGVSVGMAIFIGVLDLLFTQLLEFLVTH